jgi:hypothetical protein
MSLILARQRFRETDSRKRPDEEKPQNARQAFQSAGARGFQLHSGNVDLFASGFIFKDRRARRCLNHQILVLLLSWLSLIAALAESHTGVQFAIKIPEASTNAPLDGRIFVILSRVERPEPRLLLGQPGADAPVALARDVNAFAVGQTVLVDRTAFSFPITNFAETPTADYYVQAVFDSSLDLRSPNAPGNRFSRPQRLHLEPARDVRTDLNLTDEVPPDELPPDTDQVRFVRIQSKLLSEFHHRPIFLRAGIVLPRDFEREPSRRYPLWVRIGGLNTRYTSAAGLLAKDSRFRKTWLSDQTKRFVLLQLDGAGPFGDPYQINSANSGPYGDALVQELIPYVEAKFRALGLPRARVLSGTSTGGWVSLALQIFYPDFFNGVWSSSPDPVDFRAFELVNIYQDANAFIDREGKERASERSLGGQVKLTMRREVGVENLLGRGNSYTRSGEQWGEWNAAYSLRGVDGSPVPLWDPQTGEIDHKVAHQWKQYDLRLVLERNWPTLAPKLRHKIHIAVGEADEYYLNKAVHLLDDWLSQANPPFEGRIVYGPGKGHGWMNVTLEEMLKEMAAAAEPKPNG